MTGRCFRKQIPGGVHRMNRKELLWQVEAYGKGRCRYTWDELEEIITGAFDDDKITSDDFDEIMEKLMAIDALEDEDWESEE